ncbi:unnamed protein product [Urochloa humidicola]
MANDPVIIDLSSDEDDDNQQVIDDQQSMIIDVSSDEEDDNQQQDEEVEEDDIDQRGEEMDVGDNNHQEVEEDDIDQRGEQMDVDNNNNQHEVDNNNNQQDGEPIYVHWPFPDELLILNTLAADRRRNSSGDEKMSTRDLYNAINGDLKRKQATFPDLSKKVSALKTKFKEAVDNHGPGQNERDQRLYELSKLVWPEE